MDRAATTTQGTAGCKPLTTFVQTDTHTFREVVQRLTGPSDHHHHHQSNNNNASTNPALQDQVVGHSKMMMMGTSTSSVKRTTSKLHERRQCMRPKLEIVKPNFYFKPAESFSPTKAPSPLGTPSSIISKLSIQENKAEAEEAVAVLNRQEEERAIKERRFYLHPSPREPRQLGGGDTTTNQVPQLLTLFPLSSPRDATADDHNP
ncbi:hypothetical protein FNV43_RR13897 [Rhamnella rubrinervis]|uniref:VQ domain-containing protein n=1 Tax=Rhamnella rubrinervis TaxID=2594499 RepID=A0A8K0H1Z8_9ROSA|nr:hypothetical protein FNV43_RR13897 [Rhamnella rubrinervis]